MMLESVFLALISMAYAFALVYMVASWISLRRFLTSTSLHKSRGAGGWAKPHRPGRG